MTYFFPPGTALTDEQVAIILQSPLVQTDPTTGQRFIEITPIAIVAAPEPTTLLLLGGGLGVALIVAAINRARRPDVYPANRG